MAFTYPLDVQRLLSLARARGPALVEHVGLEPSLRDDMALTRLVWSAGQGWFPVMPDRSPHFAVDLGLPEGEGGSWQGAPVLAIGEGEVVFVDRGHLTAEGYAFGRVIVRHPVPGGDAFALYQHLDEVRTHTGDVVEAGQELGNVGWHGAFPHLHFAIASKIALGGAEDLVPEAPASSLPAGDGVWNLLRVQVEQLAEEEWPVLSGESPWYHYNPIEFVRWCRGETLEHDAGRGSLHGVALTSGESAHDAQVGRNNEATCEVPLLHNELLAGCEAWLRLAHDPGFSPIGRGDPEPGPGAFKAMQGALRGCGYELGSGGPAHDGVDGIFGRTMERVLRTFQEKRLKQLDLSLFARTPDDVRTDGRIDWLTLMGLDAVSAAHREAPPENLPTPAREPPAVEPPPAQPLPAPPSGTIVFDARAASRRLSMEVGLRAYQALLDWSDESQAPCGYSTPGAGALNDDHYVGNFGKGFSEWPRLPAKHVPVGKVNVDNAILKAEDVPTYYAFGVEWKGTHFTNCCNSQLAALCVALGGGAFSVLTDEGEVAYDVTSDKPTLKVQVVDKKKKKKVEASVPALRVFEGLAVCRNELYFDLDGNDLFSMDEFGFPSGMRVLKLGEPISKFTTDQADLVKLRVGDATHTEGHAFMIGDVRYGVWLTPESPGRNSKKPKDSPAPDYVCDQSGFIRAARPVLYKAWYGSPVYSPGGTPLTAAECDKIIAEEAEYERRVAAFLALRAGGSLEVDTYASTKSKPETLTLGIERIEVLGWRCLSANGTKATVHSSQWKADTGASWRIDEDATTKARKSGGIGIGRPWRKADRIAFGRYYAVTRKG